MRDTDDGINEAAWDRAMVAPAPARRIGPRTSLRRDAAGGGWTYRITLAGVVVAEGWTAGNRADAHREAAGRCAAWAATGSWSAP